MLTSEVLPARYGVAGKSCAPVGEALELQVVVCGTW